MSFRALLVSKDDQAVETLTPVLSNFGLTVHRCLYRDALCLVSEQKFHAVLVDFDDPHSATLTFENLSAARFRAHAVTVALLADRSKVRNAFGAGAASRLQSYRSQCWRLLRRNYLTVSGKNSLAAQIARSRQ